MLKLLTYCLVIYAINHPDEDSLTAKTCNVYSHVYLNWFSSPIVKRGLQTNITQSAVYV